MVMIGSITLNARSRDSEGNNGICLSCLDEAEEVAVDNSFSDQFGCVTDWDTGSSCCEAEVVDGQIWLDKTTDQVAAKDYEDVAKGQKYRKRIRKGWYDDPEKGRTGIFEIERWIPKSWR